MAGQSARPKRSATKKLTIEFDEAELSKFAEESVVVGILRRREKLTTRDNEAIDRLIERGVMRFVEVRR